MKSFKTDTFFNITETDAKIHDSVIAYSTFSFFFLSFHFLTLKQVLWAGDRQPITGQSSQSNRNYLLFIRNNNTEKRGT